MPWRDSTPTGEPGRSALSAGELRALAVLVLFVLMGAGPGFLAWRAGATSGAGVLGHAYAAGAGFFAVTLFLLSWVTGAFGPVAVPGLGLSALSLAAALLLRRGGHAPPQPPGGRAGVAALALLGIALAQALAVFVFAAGRPVWQYDALTIWMFKARAFVHDGGIGPYYAETERGFTQPHYPPLVSLAAAGFHLLLGREDDRLVRLLFAGFFAALLGSLYGIARTRCGRLAAALPPALVAALPCFAYRIHPPGVGADSALADVPLALFLLLATAPVAIARRPTAALAGWCGIPAAFAAWTKQEGLLVPLTTAGLLLFAGDADLRRRARLLAVFLGSTLLLLAPWLVFQAGLPRVDDTDYLATLTAARLWMNLDRVPVILGRVLSECADATLWGWFWPLTLGFVALAPRRLFSNGAGSCLAVALVHFAAYIVVYTTENFLGREAYLQKMDVSLTRLLMHLAPLAAFAVALQAEEIFGARTAPDGAEEGCAGGPQSRP